MQELQNFATVLMNHVRNSDRTSMDDVLLAFDAWRNKHQDRLREIQERQEKYRAQHEDPRNERMTAYQQYVETKRATAPPSKRVQDLKQWLAMNGVPEVLKEGLQTDLIYTSCR